MYTQGEVDHLNRVIESAKKQPLCSHVLLKDDETLRNAEIALYEDEGMLILDADTDYDLKNGHTEVMITHQQMLQLFKDFFMRVLIKDYVHPESETCRYLRYLIDEIKHLQST